MQEARYRDGTCWGQRWDGAGLAFGRGSLRARLWRRGEASWGGALFRGHRQGGLSSTGGAGKF